MGAQCALFGRSLLLVLLFGVHGGVVAGEQAQPRPNFLFVISDDQSWEHTSYSNAQKNSFEKISTPAFDQIAQQGVYFHNAFVSVPSCTASRSSILSGRHFWQTGSGALLWGEYPAKLPNFIHQLEDSGYQAAYTGKGWGPGFKSDSGRPTGVEFNQLLSKAGEEDGYVGSKGYTKNFQQFLKQRAKDKPFFFWMGLFEPHRDYLDKKTNRYANDDFENVKSQWPAFMPYTGRSQKQFSRYLEEIEYGDREMREALDVLEQQGLLENTVVIYTSDNGMPFAGAKANLYRYGVQVPLAIWWKGHHLGAMTNNDNKEALISLIDIAPTVLDMAGVPFVEGMQGQSLKPLLQLKSAGEAVWKQRDYVLTGFERHTPDAREDFSTYPVRALVNRQWFYIHNYQPKRSPQGGTGRVNKKDYPDAAIEHLSSYKGKQYQPFFNDLLGMRPERELYAWPDPPGAQFNQAGKHPEVIARLEAQLQASLMAAADPGVSDRDYFFRLYGKPHPDWRSGRQD